jgi:hypothetical protein
MAKGTNKLVRSTRDQSRIAGFQKHFSASTQVLIGNVQYTQAAVIQVYQSDLNADAAVATALAAYRKAVADAATVHQTTDSFDLSVKKFVTGSFGQPPGPAGDFGLAPPVTHVPDANTKAQAVVKRAATRAARHTMGPRQKASVTGTSPVAPAPSGGSSSVASNGAAPAVKS